MAESEEELKSLLNAKLLQLCPTLCDPMDCSPPGSSVHGILQPRIQGVDCHCLQVSSLSLIQMASSVILHDYIDNMRKIAFRKNTVKVLCIFLKDKVFTFSLCTFWVRDLSERAIKVLPIFVAAQHNSKLKYQENLRRKKKKSI